VYSDDSAESQYLGILTEVRGEHLSRRAQGLDDEIMLTSLDAVRIVELCNDRDVAVDEFIGFCSVNGLIDERLERFINQTSEQKRYRTSPEGLDKDAFNRLAVDVLRVLAQKQGEEKRRLEEENAWLKKLAFTDKLTQLKNRTYYEEYLPKLLELAKKNGVPVSYIIVDADDFKEVNENYGHDVGDDVLRNIAANIADAVRSSDDIVTMARLHREDGKVVRLGGEEFVVILVGVPLEDAKNIAERIKRNIYVFDETTGEAVIEIEDRVHSFERPISASVGVGCLEAGSIARYKDISAAILSLYQAADFALNLAKRTGKDRVRTDEDGLRKFMTRVEEIKTGEIDITELWPDLEKERVRELVNILAKDVKDEWKRLGVNGELEILDRNRGIVRVKFISPTRDLLESSPATRDQI